MSRHYALCAALGFTELTGRRPRMARTTAAEWGALVEHDGHRWELRPEALRLARRDRTWKAARWLQVQGFALDSDATDKLLRFHWQGQAGELVLPDGRCVAVDHAYAHRSGRITIRDAAGEEITVGQMKNGAPGGRPAGLPGQMDEVARKDRSNCAVCSLAWITGRPYAEVREICERRGWNQGRHGMLQHQILNALVDLGWGHSQVFTPFSLGADGRTLAAVQRRLRQSKDSWLVFTRGHVLACRAGRFEDTAACGSRTQVVALFRVGPGGSGRDRSRPGVGPLPAPEGPVRYVYCPGGPAGRRNVPLGLYVRAVRLAKANPDTKFRHGLSSWWPTSGRQIVRQFRRGVHERINDAVPYVSRNGEPQ